MSSERKKIVIAGAGPVGCYLGRLLAEKGFDPLLIEEHEALGRPIHCAGLIGDKVIKEMRIPFPRECIVNDIDGAVIRLEDRELGIKREEVAHVIDREIFDRAMGEGLDIHLGTRYIGVERSGGGHVVGTDRGSIEADIVVGADGANSLVRKSVIGGKNLSFLKGAQFRIRHKADVAGRVEVFVKKPYFYWMIPESDSVVRVGVISKNPYQDLTAFVKERGITGERLGEYAGLVIKSHSFPIAKKGIFLVGDAASQVKPLTYGGVYMGMRAAEILADAICKEKPEEYPALWKRSFGREIEVAALARSIFEKLSLKEIKRFYAFIAEHADFVEESGDFEKHSDLIMEFIKKRFIPEKFSHSFTGGNKDEIDRLLRS